MPIRAIIIPITLLLFALIPAAAGEEEDVPASSIVWPVVTPNDGGELRLYHPQVETFKGNRITGRAAFSITTATQTQPTFGVVWLAARAVTDREARTITLSDQTATKVHLPGASDQEEQAVSAAVTRLVKGLDPVVSLDRILASLSEAEHERESSEGLSTAPPKIIVVERRAVLLYVDGEPVAAPLAGSRFERIQNTPFLVARDPANGACWLLYGGRWYSAAAIAGPWTVADRVSDEVMKLAPLLQGAVADKPGAPAGPPVDIVVSLESAELISSDGPATYEPIQGTGLLAISNSESDLFIDTASQQRYLLLAGRWYRTGDPAHGPWEFVPPSGLPKDFSRIPPDSKYGTVLAHVPGTSAAEEAALDAQVPQTAAVKRDATITVDYDGAPQWQPITTTSLSYATNTPLAVIKAADNDYYCCAQGVWYRAPSASGPWTVATSIPADVARIPPDNPLYNTRYVYVYDTTPDYVYVGYSPGYFGCYIYNGCVVWGTGFHYRGWWGHQYYPRPATWGFGMAYNPWTGHWGVGVHSAFAGSNAGVAINVGVGVHGGWWGPAGYRPVIAHRPPGENQWNHAGVPPRSEPAQFERSPSNNLYRRPENSGRVLPTTISRTPVHAAEPRQHQAPASAPREPERIVPGHDGEVFRKNGDGWQQWQRDGWKPMPKEGASPAPAPTDHLPPQPARREPPPPPVAEGHPIPATPHGERPAQVPPPVERPQPPPINNREVVPHGEAIPHGEPVRPTPAPPSRTEQLERQQRYEERGTQRSQQFQQYRSNPPENLRQPASGGAPGPRH